MGIPMIMRDNKTQEKYESAKAKQRREALYAEYADMIKHTVLNFSADRKRPDGKYIVKEENDSLPHALVENPFAYCLVEDTKHNVFWSQEDLHEGSPSSRSR